MTKPKPVRDEWGLDDRAGPGPAEQVAGEIRTSIYATFERPWPVLGSVA